MLRFIIFLGLIIRVAISLWNGFFGPSYGADMDALSFHLKAVEHMEGLPFDEFVIGWVYSYLLGLVYYLFTDSLFLGGLLSDVFWLFSAIYLLKIFELLKVTQPNTIRALLIYALLPSSLLLTSVTLREPYQMAFCNIIAYSVLKIYLHKSNRHWLLLGLAIVGASVLHGALMAWDLLLLISLFLVKMLDNRNGIATYRIALAIIIFGFILWYGASQLKYVNEIFESGLVSAIESYQVGVIGIDARANYRTVIDVSNLGDLASFIPMALFQYLFEPMPWKISTPSDVVVFLENLLRLWLFLLAWHHIKFVAGSDKKIAIGFAGSYLILQLFWSIGTGNWGTAIRHHLPGMGLLLIASFAFARGKFSFPRSARGQVLL